MKTLSLCWIGLALLSLATVGFGSAGSGALMAGGVLVAALGKAWLIVDRFMELHRAPRFWRGLLLAWPLAMAAAIGLTLALR